MPTVPPLVVALTPAPLPLPRTEVNFPKPLPQRAALRTTRSVPAPAPPSAWPAPLRRRQVLGGVHELADIAGDDARQRVEHAGDGALAGRRRVEAGIGAAR